MDKLTETMRARAGHLRSQGGQGNEDKAADLDYYADEIDAIAAQGVPLTLTLPEALALLAEYAVKAAKAAASN